MIFRARCLLLSERRIIAEEQEQEDHQETWPVDVEVV